MATTVHGTPNNNSQLGGLIGTNAGVIDGSSANVTLDTATAYASGGLVGSNAVNGTTSFSAAGVTGAYPSTYSPNTRPDDVYRVVDTVGTGAEFDISSPSGTDPVTIANQLAGSRSTDYSLYKVMSSGKATVAGQSAVTQRFAFVESNGLTGAAPVVRQG